MDNSLLRSSAARKNLQAIRIDPFEIGDATRGRLVPVYWHNLCVYSSHIDLRAVAECCPDDVEPAAILIRDRSLCDRIACSSKGLEVALDQAQKHSGG
jgi:hypothetical protein